MYAAKINLSFSSVINPIFINLTILSSTTFN